MHVASWDCSDSRLTVGIVEATRSDSGWQDIFREVPGGGAAASTLGALCGAWQEHSGELHHSRYGICLVK